MNGFAMPELSLKKLCSSPFYHTFSYPAFLLCFLSICLAQLPSPQVSGWPLKALFKNECNICHLPFLWCLAISTAAVVLYWIGQQFQDWVPSELLSETVWSQQSVNITSTVLSKNLLALGVWESFWGLSPVQLEWGTAGVKSSRTARTGWMFCTARGWATQTSCPFCTSDRWQSSDSKVGTGECPGQPSSPLLMPSRDDQTFLPSLYLHLWGWIYRWLPQLM